MTVLEDLDTRYRNVVESAKRASETPLTEPVISCYMCGQPINKPEWTIIWNNRLPITESNLYDLCDFCYMRIVKYAETEHQRGGVIPSMDF